jgi:hypothetical protein
LVVLILAAGLAIDIGYMRYQRRLVQMAADSAAIAGAANMIAGAADVNCTGAACASGEAGTNSWYNGFNPALPGTMITVSNPPADGAYAGSASYVEASITQSVPMFFVKALGSSFGSFPVTARAVAYPGPSPSCIYALAPSSQGGAVFTGLNTDLEATTCTFNDGGSLCIQSSSYIVHTLGLVYVGPYSCAGSTNVSPTPVLGAPAGNPLTYLSNNIPPTTGCGASCSCVTQGYTYCDGPYPNGINITGGNVSFKPGNYVLGGNGLSISGSNGQVTGSGVTFYTNGSGTFSINSNADYGNACSSSPPPGATIGMTVQLSAPTGSAGPMNPYAGVLFIQAESQPTLASTITLNNGDSCNVLGQMPSSYLWGVLYLPSTPLTLNGTGLDTDNACSNIPRFTIVVAYTLTMEGNVNFGVSDCPAGSPATPYQFVPPLPDPIKDAVLVE